MSFLRWAGSKRRLLGHLLHCWHASQESARGTGKYIEGFAGSGALFFQTKPTRAVLIDINQDLIHCFKTVKEMPSAVHRSLGLLHPSEATYYMVRALQTDELSDVERAARFIFLNRFCFNGLYRTNLKGEFNVPYGGFKSGALPAEDELKLAAATLKAAELIAGDFYQAISDTAFKGDFVYMDPPYARRNSSLDCQYGPDTFGVRDIDRMSMLAEELHDRGASFVISYASCEEVEPLARRWFKHEVGVQRTIAANSKRRTTAAELFITNL